MSFRNLIIFFSITPALVNIPYINAETYELQTGKFSFLETGSPITSVVKGNPTWTVEESPEKDGVYIWGDEHSLPGNITVYTESTKYSFGVTISDRNHADIISTKPKLRHNSNVALTQALEQSDPLQQILNAAQKNTPTLNKPSLNESANRQLLGIQNEKQHNHAPKKLVIKESKQSIFSDIDTETKGYNLIVSLPSTNAPKGNGANTTPKTISSFSTPIEINAGDTFFGLADKTKPKDLSAFEWRQGLFWNNKQAFVDNNINSVKVGEVLNIPPKGSTLYQKVLPTLKVEKQNKKTYQDDKKIALKHRIKTLKGELKNSVAERQSLKQHLSVLETQVKELNTLLTTPQNNREG